MIVILIIAITYSAKVLNEQEMIETKIKSLLCDYTCKESMDSQISSLISDSNVMSEIVEENCQIPCLHRSQENVLSETKNDFNKLENDEFICKKPRKSSETITSQKLCKKIRFLVNDEIQYPLNTQKISELPLRTEKFIEISKSDLQHQSCLKKNSNVSLTAKKNNVKLSEYTHFETFQHTDEKLMQKYSEQTESSTDEINDLNLQEKISQNSILSTAEDLKEIDDSYNTILVSKIETQQNQRLVTLEKGFFNKRVHNEYEYDHKNWCFCEKKFGQNKFAQNIFFKNDIEIEAL